MKSSETPDEAKPAWSNWFEVPVEDFDRAKTFYETVFDTEIHVMDFGGFAMGIFPHKEHGAAICKGPGYTPGPTGPIVYMNANPDLSVAEGKIEAAGGKILQAKKQISEDHGFMALFEDTEGNRLALHSFE